MSKNKDRRQPPPKGFGALQDIRRDLPASGKPGAPVPPSPTRPAGYPSQSTTSKPEQPPLLDSARIEDPRRASRAPYNFIPQAPRIHWLSAPPDSQATIHTAAQEGAGKHDPACLYGEIDLQLTARTDFFLPGLTNYQEFLNGRETKSQTLPYMVNGKLAIPGTALRGMTRAMVEIMSNSPLDPVNDRQLFFRTVAANQSPGDKNFEPHAIAYKSRMDHQQVRAGYLHGGLDQWTIRPAETDENGRQFYQVSMRDLAPLLGRKPEWLRREVWFRPAKGSRADVALEERPGFRKGWLVCSGPMQGKKWQWVMLPPDPSIRKEDLVRVGEQDVRAYQEDGATRDLRGSFQYPPSASDLTGRPCFYTSWTDSDGNPHTGFGHTRFFRLAYVATTASGIPAKLSRAPGETRWDMAQAIFGRAPKSYRDAATQKEAAIPGARGRVFFEDALWQSGPEPAYASEIKEVALGAPKPTSFELYLNQPNASTADAIHWDGDRKGRRDGPYQPVARGFKRWWIRKGAPLSPPPRNKDGEVNEDTLTRMQPAFAGAVFRARVRFQGLRASELGALLATMDTAAGLAHQLGRAKPLGLGGFRLEVLRLRTLDVRRRYLNFVDAKGVLEEGWNPPEPANAYKEAFARELGTTWAQLWEQPRMQALKAMMTEREPSARWLALTRYMTIRPVNEYQYFVDARGTQKQVRRPLPPALQVAAQGPELPDTPEPAPHQAPQSNRGAGPGQGRRGSGPPGRPNQPPRRY